MPLFPWIHENNAMRQVILSTFFDMKIKQNFTVKEIKAQSNTASCPWSCS